MTGNDDCHPPIWASNVEHTKADFCKQDQSIEDLLVAIGPTQANESNSKPKIQQVPSILRSEKNLKQFFEPRFISFGPFHYGKAKYQEAETFKLDWAKKFIKHCGESVAVLMSRIEEHIQELRSCFECEIKLSDKNLAMFLLVEGCAVLHFIYCMVEKSLDDLYVNSTQAAFVERDMFLLENQIPFRVLQILIAPDDLRYIERRKSWVIKIKDFIYSTTFASHIQRDRKPSGEYLGQTQRAPHLLGLLRESLISSQWRRELSMTAIRERQNNREKGGLEVEEKYWEKNMSVVELKELGVKFEARKSGFINDIGYSKHLENRINRGLSCRRVPFSPIPWSALRLPSLRLDVSTLRIPSVRIDVSAGPTLMNLIAYENRPDFQNKFEVTSYICFLNALIDGPEDVKELRRADIVRNCLGSDEEVAQLFHEMAKDLVPNLQLFEAVRKGIRMYCNSKRSSFAHFFNTHFKAPWSLFATIATFATIAATILTAYQLYYALHPNK